MDNLKYKKVSQEKNKYKFEAVVPQEAFDNKREDIFKQMSKSVKIAGFRPGMAPKAEIEKKIAYEVYIETINKVIPEVAIEILKKEELSPISTLNYDLSEGEKDEKGIKFTFEFLNQPDIDVKKLENLKVEKNKVEVKDEEVSDVIKNLIKSSLPREKWEKYIIKSDKAGKSTKKAAADTEDKDAKDSKVVEDSEDIELNDELIKELGYEDEKDLAGVTAKVKETLANIKEEQAEAEFSTKLVEAALKAAEFEIPHEYVHREMEEREAQFKKRLKDLKLNEEVYLRTQGKTMDDLRQEWHAQSEIDLATDLLLINLAMKEKRIPTDEEVEAELVKLEPQTQAFYKQDKNRDYLKTALTRNNGMKRLVELNTKKSK